jgi:hypothetical protein
MLSECNKIVITNWLKNHEIRNQHLALYAQNMHGILHKIEDNISFFYPSFKSRMKAKATQHLSIKHFMSSIIEQRFRW